MIGCSKGGTAVVHRILTFLLICWFILPCLSVNAESQTITAVGEYVMGDGETMFVAKERAVEQAMRAASEQAGVYIESYSRVNNLVLTKDEINILSRSVVKIKDKQFDEPKYTGSGFIIRVTITALVDSDSIATVRNSMKEKLSVDSYKQMQLEYAKAQRQIEDLKRQLNDAKTEQEKKKAIAEIARNEQKFTATQWYDQGYNHAAKWELDEAIAAFDQAIALNPQYDYAYLNRGWAYYAKNYSGKKYPFDENNFTKALADYNQAIAINPANSEAYFRRADIHNVNGQLDLAIKDCSKAIALNPTNAKYYLERGRLQVLGHFPQNEKAILDYSKAISLSPDFEDAYTRRGHAYFDLGQFDKAMADYTQAIRLAPTHSTNYYWLGRCYQSKGLYEEAVKYFDQSISLNPDGWSAKYEKADCLRKIADLKQPFTATRWYEEALGLSKTAPFSNVSIVADRAIEYFGKAITLDPTYTLAYFQRGKYYANFKNKPQLAIPDLTKAIQLGLQDSSAYFMLGTSHAKLGQYDQAILNFSWYIAATPKADGYVGRADAYAKNGEYALAISDYDQAIALNQNPWTYIARGKTYLLAGQYDLALADANKVLANKPSFSQLAAAAYNLRGHIYLAQGQYSNALSEFNQALAVCSYDYEAYYGKAMACEKLGKINEAIEAYHLFINKSSFQGPTLELQQKVKNAKQRLAALGE